MTILDKPRADPQGGNAQLLFQEARQRRRRRRLISGMTAAALVVALLALTLGLTLGGNGRGPSGSGAVPGLLPATGHPVADLSFRPVLCYAPPLTLAAGQVASPGALPSCSPSTQLNASNLDTTPDSDNVNGYLSNTNIRADAQFTTYPSTATSGVTNDATVLLPGVPANGDDRYVLGPAALTQRGVKTARAIRESRTVGRQSCPHPWRVDRLGRSDQATVPRDRRRGPQRQGRFCSDHTAHAELLDLVQRSGADLRIVYPTASQSPRRRSVGLTSTGVLDPNRQSMPATDHKPMSVSPDSKSPFDPREGSTRCSSSGQLHPETQAVVIEIPRKRAGAGVPVLPSELRAKVDAVQVVVGEA